MYCSDTEHKITHLLCREATSYLYIILLTKIGNLFISCLRFYSSHNINMLLRLVYLCSLCFILISTNLFAVVWVVATPRLLSIPRVDKFSCTALENNYEIDF